MKSRADVAALMAEIFARCQTTRDAGQKEYAHDDNNALANFERGGADLAIPREKVWYIYANKHWDGVLAWINGHRSQREDVRGRIMDLIVYLVLLWAMADDDTGATNSGAASVVLAVDPSRSSHKTATAECPASPSSEPPVFDLDAELKALSHACRRHGRNQAAPIVLEVEWDAAITSAAAAKQRIREYVASLLDELTALRTSLSSVSRERDALTAQLKVATTPDVLNVIGEDGCEFLETAFGGLFETIPANECREVWANKSLPNHWAALLYRAADDSASIEIFPTEADARAAIAASLAVSSPTGDSL